ncbi:MAG: ChbG/HpnK family deacetylase, partial [Acidobacteriota bacterium]|nr:ChbG/HpnK family deacetylase [Acidobacteriota bacterium]
MSAKLIVNADDFGLTRGVNQAVAELHDAGVLTSTTLMATGGALHDAVRLLHERPHLGVGCHLVFTDGVPLSPPEAIPSLIGPDQRSLRPRLLDFAAAVLLGRIHEDDLFHEACAQLQHLQHLGIHLTHVDTHKHTHCFPVVARAVLRAALHCGVAAVRHPFEPEWSARLSPAASLRRVQIAALNRLQPAFQRELQAAPGVRTTQGTIGISATGSLDAATLHDILQALPNHGTFELCCHPGYNDAELDTIVTRLRQSREVERLALL